MSAGTVVTGSGLPARVVRDLASVAPSAAYREVLVPAVRAELLAELGRPVPVPVGAVVRSTAWRDRHSSALSEFRWWATRARCDVRILGAGYADGFCSAWRVFGRESHRRKAVAR